MLVVSWVAMELIVGSVMFVVVGSSLWLKCYCSLLWIIGIHKVAVFLQLC